MKCVAAALLAGTLASGTSLLEAQTPRRRETNANRLERIARTTEETYNHRWEVAGGGGYLRFRSGEYLQKNQDVTFWMSGTYYLRPKLGIVADVRGLYGRAKIGNTDFNLRDPHISTYPFLAGVTYRLYAKEKIAVNVTGEGGAALGKFDGDTKKIPSKYLGLWQSNTRPAFSAGVSLDYNFYPNIAFRVAPTYLGTFYHLDPLDAAPSPHGSIQNNFGVNLGFIYRFGKINK